MMTYPEGLIKSTVHAAAIYENYFPQLGKYIFPVRKKYFSRLGIKKSLRLEAIGDNGRLAG